MAFLLSLRELSPPSLLVTGKLPPQCADACRSNVTVQELAVRGATTGDREMVFQSILHDPLSAAVCGIEEVRQMVNELFVAEAQWLPQFPVTSP